MPFELFYMDFSLVSTHAHPDTPPSSLMDSIVNPKVKTVKGGVGVRSLAHSTSRVEGLARAPGWD
jgi:hypothetical protein